MNNKQSKFLDKTLMGIDYGEVTTGLALGKNGLVTPIKSVRSRDVMVVIKEIIKLIKLNKVEGIVLGLPLDFNHKETHQSRLTRRFAKILKSKVGVPVLFIEEFGTTQEATKEDFPLEEPLFLSKKGSVDEISAALILKRFFAQEGF